MIRKLKFAAWAVALLGVSATQAADLKGKFVVVGDPPPPAAVTAPQAATDFPTLKLVYEDVVVDPATKGLANVLIYVRTAGVAITPEAAAAPVADVVIDNKNGQFTPHATGLWIGKQKLFVKNSDPVAHNSNFVAGGVNYTIPVGGQLEYPLVPASNIPKVISCNIHGWMNSFIVFADHPYVTASGADGGFVLKNLPADTALEIQFWHEKRGYLEVVPKGRQMVTVPAAGLDLGEIKVPSELLTPKPAE